MSKRWLLGSVITEDNPSRQIRRLGSVKSHTVADTKVSASLTIADRDQFREYGPDLVRHEFGSLVSTRMTSSQPLRRVTSSGVAAMVAGLGLTILELTTHFIEGRLGVYGKYTILTCGTLFSVWGLKELIAGWWPRMGRNSLIRNRMHIPLEGAAFLAIMFVLFVGSLIGRSNPLMLVFSMMAGAFVLNGWLTFTSLKGVHIERVLPERAMAGDPFSVELTLVNRKRILSSWLMSAVDHIEGLGVQLTPEIVFIRVAGRESQRGHYHVQLAKRGVYTLGPVHVDTRFPLGLVQRGISLPVPASLKVYPRLGKLTTEWRRKLQTATEQTASQASHAGHSADEFHRLREYRVGDDLRSVHWRTSARRNELMVREYRDSRDRSLLVLLDTWMPPHPDETCLQSMEQAISFSATVCIEAARNSRESRTTLASLASTVTVWRGGAGGERIEDMLDSLAELVPGSTKLVSGLFEATVHDRSLQPRIVVVTARPQVVEAEIQRLAAQDHSLANVQILTIGSREIGQVFETL